MRSRDDCPRDVLLDQYYTREDVAARLWGLFRRRYGADRFLMVEPSAGDGSFLKVLPAGSVGIDIDPKAPGIRRVDYLEAEIVMGGHREVATIGNPPFGLNCSTAIRFFNRAAEHSRVIAFVVPRTFRKAWAQNQLDPAFHLVFEEEVERDAFLFRGAPFNVPAVFQIWQRMDEPRPRRPTATRHPHFEFTTADRADFAIQRVGAAAGRIHREFSRSPSAHLFVRVKGKRGVEAVMARLDLAAIARDVAGNPSISRAEIVECYSAAVGCWPSARRPGGGGAASSRGRSRPSSRRKNRRRLPPAHPRPAGCGQVRSRRPRRRLSWAPRRRRPGSRGPPARFRASVRAS